MAGAYSKIGNLEDEALKRREKLKNLKRKREVNGTAADHKNTNAETLPKPFFRSYKPANEELKEFVLDPCKPGNVTEEVKGQLESAKSDMVIDQLDVSSLAPRKPDWDLKRDVAKKLAKLERQTQKAIAELIRERLKESRDNENLAAIVNAVAPDNT